MAASRLAVQSPRVWSRRISVLPSLALPAQRLVTGECLRRSAPNNYARLFSITPYRRDDGAETRPESSPDYFEQQFAKWDEKARGIRRTSFKTLMERSLKDDLDRQYDIAKVAIKPDSTVEELTQIAPELSADEASRYRKFIQIEYTDMAALDLAYSQAKTGTSEFLASKKGQDWIAQRSLFVNSTKEGLSAYKNVRADRGSFWNQDEEDAEIIVDEEGDDDFQEDDITSMAHGKLEEHREHREYARVAVWEMPLLSKYAKPFEPPTPAMALRFRYTTYMGEFHPAERKVVVEFCPEDLDLTEAQQLKMKKLVGPRYNPEKGIVKMSCEMFEHQAQNKRYLGDLVEKLVAESKDPTDMFEDIPLDTRHHDFKTKPKFPKEWRMTDARRAELQALRAQSFRLDQPTDTVGLIEDGQSAATKSAAREEISELVRVPVRGTIEKSPPRL